MNRLLLLAGVILVALSVGITARANASDIPGPPTAPCTLKQRMNVHVIDGWLYECACSVLATGFHCEWNLVGQVAHAARKPIHRKRARLIPVLYLPSVTA